MASGRDGIWPRGWSGPPQVPASAVETAVVEAPLRHGADLAVVGAGAGWARGAAPGSRPLVWPGGAFGRRPWGSRAELAREPGDRPPRLGASPGAPGHGGAGQGGPSPLDPSPVRETTMG